MDNNLLNIFSKMLSNQNNAQASNNSQPSNNPAFSMYPKEAFSQEQTSNNDNKNPFEGLASALGGDNNQMLSLLMALLGKGGNLGSLGNLANILSLGKQKSPSNEEHLSVTPKDEILL